MAIRNMKQSDVLKCPFVIIAPEHYRSDGTCKCDDQAERDRMIREWEYTTEDFIEVGVISRD